MNRAGICLLPAVLAILLQVGGYRFSSPQDDDRFRYVIDEDIEPTLTEVVGLNGDPRAQREEAEMVEELGDEYVAYRDRVPMFLPRPSTLFANETYLRARETEIALFGLSRTHIRDDGLIDIMESNCVNVVLNELRAELKARVDDHTRNTSQRYFKERVNMYGVKTSTVSKIAKKYFKAIEALGKDSVFDLCENLFESGLLEESFIARAGVSLNLDPLVCGGKRLAEKHLIRTKKPIIIEKACTRYVRI